MPVHDIVMYPVYIQYIQLNYIHDFADWKDEEEAEVGDIKVHPCKISRSGEPNLAICDHFGHGL